MSVEALSFPEDAGISLHLLGQGIVVFGWVTLWEALVNLLWTWQPIYRQLHMCQRLQQAAVEVDFLKKESTALSEDNEQT